MLSALEMCGQNSGSGIRDWASSLGAGEVGSAGVRAGEVLCRGGCSAGFGVEVGSAGVRAGVGGPGCTQRAQARGSVQGVHGVNAAGTSTGEVYGEHNDQ